LFNDRSRVSTRLLFKKNQKINDMANHEKLNQVKLYVKGRTDVGREEGTGFYLLSPGIDEHGNFEQPVFVNTPDISLHEAQVIYLYTDLKQLRDEQVIAEGYRIEGFLPF
jgi:hypothetical protein